MVSTKVFKIFNRFYSLFKSELLNANMKLILHKAPILSVMTYVYPAWGFAVDIHLLKSQRQQNNVLQHTVNFPRCTTGFPTFHMYIIISENCTSNNQKSYKNIGTSIFTA
jgi:hypothetical protein